MSQFNLVFQQTENGGRGIYIEDTKNNVFEGVTTDADDYEEMLKAIESVRTCVGKGVIMERVDKNGKMVISANCLEENKIVFKVGYRGVQKTDEGKKSVYYQGTTELFTITPPVSNVKTTAL
jgi:hypothetical protein